MEHAKSFEIVFDFVNLSIRLLFSTFRLFSEKIENSWIYQFGNPVTNFDNPVTNW
jgi:hypothetical protein